MKHACLRKNKKDGLCAHLGGVWLAAGGAGGLESVDSGDGRCRGPGIRRPWGREVRGAWHPWTLAAESRVLGCGAVFPSLQVVGQEISLGGQQCFLSEPSRIK